MKTIKTAKILLIEDSEVDVELIKIALKDSKYLNSLDICTNGEDGLDYIYKRNGYADFDSPDFVILDIKLPGISGKDVLEEIKNDPDKKKLPIVILTSSKSESDISEVYDKYANCYIVKPVNSEKFFNVIRKIEEFWISFVQLPTMEE